MLRGEWEKSVRRRGGKVWEHELRATDVGAGASHQGGITLPLEMLQHVVPELVARTVAGEKNPAVRLPARILSQGKELSLRFVYYNGKLFGNGTRNEARITGWKGVLSPQMVGRKIVFGFLNSGSSRWVEVWIDEAEMETTRENTVTSGRYVPVEKPGRVKPEEEAWEANVGDILRDKEEAGVMPARPSSSGWESSEGQEKRFPRLLRSEVDRLVPEFGKYGVPKNVADVRELLESRGTWVPGSRDELVDPGILEEIRNGLEACWEKARDAGGEGAEEGMFDRLGSMWWGEHQDIMPLAEALDEGVWAWISTILVPDIVAWRFPRLTVARFRGGQRNAIRRLWLRGRVLDRGAQLAPGRRWYLLESLTEDALVQLFERPTIAANGELARRIAEKWVEQSREHGRGAMEDLHRVAMKALRAEATVVSLDYLTLTGEIDLLIERCYRRAVRGEVG